MNWNIRKYADEEARQHLSEAITDESLHNQVEAAYNDSIAAIERKEAEIQEIYSHIESLLAQTSEASGVSQEVLVTIARRIGATSRDLEWYQVLSIINSFYRIKAMLEKEN